MEGGFGNDTLTGGPGRDELHGDSTAAQCGGFGRSCTVPSGNDTIDARDGEVDSVDCGPGTDRVIADAGDVVAADCETVERAGGAPAAGKPGGPGATPAGASGATPRLTITAARLRTVLRSGLTVRLAGLRPGTVTVKVRVGTRVVASGRAKVAASGTATVRVRFTRAARRTPAKRKAVRLTVRAGSVSRSITVKR